MTCPHSPDDRHVGAQQGTDGQVLLLSQCDTCHTSYTSYILEDAAVCEVCRHAVSGTVGDRKVVKCYDEFTVVVCSRCDEEDTAKEYSWRLPVRRRH